ncbi:hypothetical protein AXX17_AT3G30560 [Arabidopsis thaliana]|uniref:Uncharacterized protein n=1 Tax=Arabidopsis thaliana TaxID=3702 RepID=A0A178V7B9_ARATH|nr:hypothetical protein AXX17_AT3G30560 [Arabidopsis thaliana]
MSSPHLLCEPPSRLFRLSMQPSSASSLSCKLLFSSSWCPPLNTSFFTLILGTITLALASTSTSPSPTTNVISFSSREINTIAGFQPPPANIRLCSRQPSSPPFCTALSCSRHGEDGACLSMTKSNSDSDYFDGHLRRKQLQTFTFSWLLPVLVKQQTSLRLSYMPLVRDTSQHHSHLHHQLTPPNRTATITAQLMSPLVSSTSSPMRLFRRIRPLIICKSQVSSDDLHLPLSLLEIQRSLSIFIDYIIFLTLNFMFTLTAAPNSDFLNLHNRNSTWNQNLQLRSTDSPHLHLEYKSPHRISRRLQRTISIVELPGRC